MSSDDSANTGEGVAEDASETGVPEMGGDVRAASVPTDEGAGPGGVSAEETVVAFLAENPDFLAGHPELVEHLVIPHSEAAGGAVSLIEYQVKVLKESNEELRRRLRNLVRNARDNEDTGRKVHRLCLHLLRCHGLDEVFTGAHQRFSEEFQADYSALRLFVAPKDPADARLGEFVPASEAADGSAAARLRSKVGAGKPVCGEFEPDLLESLFGDAAPEVGSAALVPLGIESASPVNPAGRAGPVGVLALASRSPDRFRRGSGTVFLQQIGEILSHAIKPHLASA